MNDDEKQEWIKKQFENSIKYYRQAVEKIPEHLSETKMKIQTEFASVLYSTENFDEAIRIYEDGFHVNINFFVVTSQYFLLLNRIMVMSNGFIMLLSVYGNKEKKIQLIVDLNKRLVLILHMLKLIK